MKKLILCILLLIPFTINAKSYSYTETSNKVNNYITNFEDYIDYIVMDNMPYNYAGNENNYNSLFTNAGLLSKDEYLATNIYGNSYLATGIEYWTLTQHSNQRQYVINYTLTSKEIDSKSDIKVTEFVKNEVKIDGSGTKNNPWYFLDVFNINFVSPEEDRGKLSNEGCDDPTKIKKMITVSKYGKKSSAFYVCEEDGYVYHSSNCQEYLEKEVYSRKMFVTGDIIDNTICKIYFAYDTYKITLENCEGCVEASPNPIYKAKKFDLYFLDSYGLNGTINKITSLPSKTGYTLEGYYNNDSFDDENKVIDNTGKIISMNIYSDTTLKLNMRPHKYNIKYDCNGGSGSTTTSEHTYDLEKNLSSVNCVKPGSIFKGWSTTAGGSVAYSDEASVKNLTSIDDGEVTLYAVWQQCETGKYNENSTFVCSTCPSSYSSSAAGSDSINDCYKTMYKKRECSQGKRCSSAGCAERNSCPNCSSCGTTTKSKMISKGGSECSSYNGTVRDGYTLSGCYPGGYSALDDCTCTATKCKSCANSSCSCKTYNRSISNCGCDTWGSWTGYVYTSCSSSNSIDCGSTKVYYPN